MRNFTFLAVSFTVAISSPLLARSEEFRWDGSVRAGQTVEVKGVNGDIEASLGSGDRVEVLAVKTGKRNDPSEVSIEVVPHEDGVTICAVYPASEKPNRCEPGERGRLGADRNDVRVDFTVHIPAGVHFSGRSVNGRVAAEGIAGDVTAQTVNGDLELTCDGQASAMTVNGSITAAFEGQRLTDDLSFETVNGSIRVELSPHVHADVRASCVNGDITTEFPLTVQGKWGPRKVEGRLGDGGPEIELKTVNGSIELASAGR